MPNSPMGQLYDPLLNLLASQVDDLEMVRIAADNRYRQLTSTKPDKDGMVRALGMPEDHKEVIKARALADGLIEIEKSAIRQLERHMRYSMWGPWLKTVPGVGEKTLARLLASVGDPYWNSLYQRPRLVSELWAYCGYDVVRVGPEAGVARARRKGQKVTWSTEARKRAFIIADTCVKQKPDTRYRKVYDETRVHYSEAVHQVDCVRCGPSGKPALAGSPLSDMHKHKRAVRAIAKEVLRDLWIEAKRLHEERELVAA